MADVEKGVTDAMHRDCQDEAAVCEEAVANNAAASQTLKAMECNSC